MAYLNFILVLLVSWILYKAYISYLEIQEKDKKLSEKPSATDTWDSVSKTAKVHFPWYQGLIPWWNSSPFSPHFGYKNSFNNNYTSWLNQPYYHHYWHRPHVIGHGYMDKYHDHPYHHYHPPRTIKRTCNRTLKPKT